MRILTPALFALLLSFPAHADDLDLNATGDARVNGADFQGAKKPYDVYADVVKVIQGPEGSTVLYLRPVEARMAGDDGAVKKFDMKAEARPFVPEGDWKMFDAEGEVTDDARFALRVIFPYTVDSEDKLLDVVWNECQGPISGNYTGLPCNRGRGLSDDYVAFLKQNYLGCVNAGMKAAGLPAAASVHIQHDGTTADENHSRGSLHAAGRAIDVMQVTALDDKGAKIGFFDFTKTNTDRHITSSCKPAGTANCQFFEAFRKCWHGVHVARHCPARQGGPIGTMGWEDSRHIAHHLHTSMPFCPNSKGYFITETK